MPSNNLVSNVIYEFLKFKRFERISKYNTTKIRRKTDHLSKSIAAKYIS